MDKYEYRIKADAIKSLIAEGDYQSAMEIADEIDWRRVKSVMMLCTVSDLYKINRRLEDSRDLLLLAYGRHPGGRTIVFSLCELSIKMGDILQAVEYYKEFVQIAPNDTGRYILQYRLYEAQEVALEERILVLEQMKKEDYREKWAFELAYLYHRTGMERKCVEECDELILWFGEGKYVDKALDLKLLHQPLTPEQQEKYDARFETVWEPEEIASGEPQAEQAAEEDIHVKTVDVGEYNTINLQKELAEGLKEVLSEQQAIEEPEVEPEEAAEEPEVESEEASKEEAVESEVFFGETSEIRLAAEQPATEGAEQVLRDMDEPIAEEPQREQEPAAAAAEDTREPQRRAAIAAVEPPKELADVLSMEFDGQLSLVVPREEAVEKQITGQMNIEDILAEWERMKNENREKNEEQVRQRVLQRTGQMFTEFEAELRDSLLAQAEEEKNAVPGVKKLSEEELPELSDGSDIEVEELEEIVELTEEAEKEEPVLIADEEREPAEEEEAEPEDSEKAPEDRAQEREPAEAEEEEPEIVIEEIKDEEENAAEQQDSEREEKNKATASAPEKQKTRALSREERELFAPYIQGRSSREQLVKALDGISMAAYTGNVIVTGPEGVNTLGLAKNIVRDVQASDRNFSGKTAKISGSSLEKQDIPRLAEDFANGALIIQKASEIPAKTAETLYKVLQQETLGILVILEDTKKAMNRFLGEHPEYMGCFTARVDVDALSDEALVTFARRYAHEMEYSIDEFGNLALHRRIDEMQTSDHVVTVLEVKEMVDAAIRHANKKNLGHFFDILLGKRYDEEDMIILREKDFV